MSESNKFTPGPWNNMPKTEYVPICKQDEAGLSLGFINSADLDRVAEGKANAYLIAAAPDLLEALEQMIDEYGTAGDGWPRNNKVLRDSRAAILKARGQK